ncbi:hypothetical protein SEA_KENNA_97 [Gordonia phage Kenna]|uniref:Uncharacterized protein n=2 Tax=Getalongvirus kenna TaxID=2734201 RepID=A0A3S9UQ07_9CAUD|nr:hypothetical protein HOU97_gp97 [Gordonia phage Kenna]AZS12373.1 hypothetical protein SEA_KENNA_97 [Gordonia phage Kenna]QCG77260.1 hypothetical protein SEA_LUTUM_103 [Gordonia phage Lutum]
MTAVEPVPVEPCAIWRLLVNGWTYDQITKLLHITGPAVMKAEQQQNLALRDVDPKLIADPMIGPPKPRGTR